MLVLNTHSHICTHTHWCFSYSSLRSVARWQSSRWLMSRCGTSRNCAFSLLNKTLEVPEKYNTSELSSAEIDFNSLLALLKHQLLKPDDAARRGRESHIFYQVKLAGSTPRPPSLVHPFTSHWKYGFERLQPWGVYGFSTLRRTRWLQEQRKFVATLFSHWTAVQKPSLHWAMEPITFLSWWGDSSATAT